MFQSSTVARLRSAAKFPVLLALVAYLTTW